MIGNRFVFVFAFFGGSVVRFMVTGSMRMLIRYKGKGVLIIIILALKDVL